uniref:Uncharacterized protein n=1 Tax=Tanacetum cinerariifolium TaxID=118510 RepID=A0A6L2LEQ7_TANCI|nr:hypothetical protein [Tanacetum cinerariifolium]GEY88678.1 hypothetical protein [Tanacetum cinerariifolium]
MTVAGKVFRRDFLANPKKTPRIAIYKIHHPPSPCTAAASPLHYTTASHHTPTANTTATTTAATAAVFPALPPSWRAVDGRMATTGVVEPIKLPIPCLYFHAWRLHRLYCEILNLVVDWSWLMSNSGCSPPNHHCGGGRTTVQPPQPHLMVSGCDGATTSEESGWSSA